MIARRIAGGSLAAALGAGLLVAVVPASAQTPKAGATCAKKDLNKTSGGLRCTKQGKNYRWVAVAAATTAAPVAPASAASLSGTVTVDGSSTVFPLAEAAAELFQKNVAKDVRVTVGESGTGGGFKKFCAGETDISNASRPISASERADCAKNNVKFEEFAVANDGLSVVVNPNNNFAACMTVAELKKIWNAGSTITNWKDVNPLYPDLGMKLFGAGTASGTFDYFSEAINGKAKVHRSDYNATEDDNVTVVGVAGSPGGIGYFGLSYALENANKVKIVQIDAGDGKCITPSTATVQDGTYKPLGRPLFIYVSAAALKKPHVEGFVEYWISNTDTLNKRALFVPLTKPQADKLKTQLTALKAAA
jgi:phosphate transport system substrate-binding protein